jgi:hypothetical protein
MNELIAVGMKSETLSVAKKHYDDMVLLVAEERIVGPAISLLTEELLQLRIIRDKVDHPRKGSKDLADAVCGSIYNAIARTPKNIGEVEIQIHSYDQFVDDSDVDPEELRPGNQKISADILDFLGGMNAI